MKYKEAITLLRVDFDKHYKYSKGNEGKFRYFCEMMCHGGSFMYILWMRLTAVKGFFYPFCWFMHHHYSRKYNVDIPYNTQIGPGFYLGHAMSIVVNSTSRIGSNVTISQFCNVGSNHNQAATIDDGVYLAPHVCLIEDVHIGENAVVGAGAVVTKNIPANEVWAGNPARFIKKRI